VRAAQQDLDGASRTEIGSEVTGELVERPDFVSFVLMASGYSLKDFKVKIERDELRVQAPDFDLTRPIGCRVEASGITTDYRNGVLSVRIAKKF